MLLVNKYEIKERSEMMKREGYGDIKITHVYTLSSYLKEYGIKETAKAIKEGRVY